MMTDFALVHKSKKPKRKVPVVEEEVKESPILILSEEQKLHFRQVEERRLKKAQQNKNRSDKRIFDTEELKPNASRRERNAHALRKVNEAAAARKVEELQLKAANTKLTKKEKRDLIFTPTDDVRIKVPKAPVPTGSAILKSDVRKLAKEHSEVFTKKGLPKSRQDLSNELKSKTQMAKKEQIYLDSLTKKKEIAREKDRIKKELILEGNVPEEKELADLKIIKNRVNESSYVLRRAESARFRAVAVQRKAYKKRQKKARQAERRKANLVSECNDRHFEFRPMTEHENTLLFSEADGAEEKRDSLGNFLSPDVTSDGVYVPPFSGLPGNRVKRDYSISGMTFAEVQEMERLDRTKQFLHEASRVSNSEDWRARISSVLNDMEKSAKLKSVPTFSMPVVEDILNYLQVADTEFAKTFKLFNEYSGSTDLLVKYIMLWFQLMRANSFGDAMMAVYQVMDKLEEGDCIISKLSYSVFLAAPAYYFKVLFERTPDSEQLKSEALSDDITGFIKHLSSVLDSPLILSIKTFILNLVGYHCFPKDVAANISSIIGKPTKAPLLEVFTDSLKLSAKVVRVGELVSSGVTLQEAVLMDDPIAHYIAKAENLLLYKDHTYSGLPTPGEMPLNDFISQGMEILLFFEKLMKRVRITSPEGKRIAIINRDLILAVSDARCRFIADTRIPPIAIVLVGEPGIGKSTLLNYIASIWSKVKGRKFSPSQMWKRNLGSEFWDGYKMHSHPIGHWSEVGSLHHNIAKMSGDPALIELTSVIDAQMMPVNMANLDDKGRTYCMLEMVIIDTNVEEMNIPHVVNNAAAYKRRFIYVKPKVLEECRKPGSNMLDSSVTDRRFFDKWQFSVYRQTPINLRESVPYSYLNGTREDGIDAFTDVMTRLFTEHITRETSVKNMCIDALDKESYGTKSDADIAKIIERTIDEFDQQLIEKYNLTSQAGPFNINLDDPYEDHRTIDVNEMKEEDKKLFLNDWVVPKKVFPRPDSALQKLVIPTNPTFNFDWKENLSLFSWLKSCAMWNYSFLVFLLQIFWRDAKIFMDILSQMLATLTLWMFLKCPLPDKETPLFIVTPPRLLACFCLMLLNACTPLFTFNIYIVIFFGVFCWQYVFYQILFNMRGRKNEEKKSFIATFNEMVLFIRGSKPFIWSHNNKYFLLTCAAGLVAAISGIVIYTKSKKNQPKTEASTIFNRTSPDIVKVNKMEDNVSAGYSYKRVGNSASLGWNMRKVTQEVTHTSDPASLYKKISKNMRRVQVRGSRDCKTMILGLCENIFVINTHSLGTPNCDVRIQIPQGGYQEIEEHCASDNLYHWDEMVHLPHDITVVRASGIKFQDITKHILKGDRSILSEGLIEGSQVTVSYINSEISFLDTFFNDNVKLPSGYAYEWINHAPGKCGVPLILKHGNGAALAGIHSAGGGLSNSRAAPLIWSDIKAAIDKLHSSGMFNMYSECTALPDTEDPVPKSPFVHESFHGIEYLGKLPGKINMKNISKVTESFLQKNIAEFDEEIFDDFNFIRTKRFGRPILMPYTSKKGEYISPYNIALSKASKKIISLDKKILLRCIDEIVARSVKILQEKGARIAPITLDAAVNGVLEDDFIRRTNASTSAGWGLSGKKKDHLPKTGDGEQRLPDDEVMSEMTRIIDCYMRKEMAAPIFSMKLKDEPTSEKKMKSGATRPFQIAPLAHLLLSKMMTGSFWSQLVEDSDLFKTEVGIDMHRQARRIYEKYEKRPNAMEGDYGSFDIKSPFDFTWAVATIVHRVCKHFGYTEEAMTILDGILSDMMFPYIEMNLDLFVVAGQEASGNAYTAERNSLKGLLMLMYAFYSIYPDKDFFNEVDPSLYGDDLLAFCTDSVPEFNNLTYAKFVFDNYNMEYTSAAKDGTLEKYVSIDTMSFLKRTFKVRDGDVIAPLDLDSICRSLLWRIPSTIATDLEQTLDIYNSALRELYFHADEKDHAMFRVYLQRKFKEQFNVSVGLILYSEVAESVAQCPTNSCREEEASEGNQPHDLRVL